MMPGWNRIFQPGAGHIPALIESGAAKNAAIAPFFGQHANMLASPAPGFDDPLALLRACHERITRQCNTLEKIAAQLASHGLTPDLRTAAAGVHRYFSTAGHYHHEDEELDLFPLLRGDAALATLIDNLQLEHVRMDALWRELEPLLAEPDTIRDTDGFRKQAMAFIALHAQHVAHENAVLLPRAKAMLPPTVLTVLGARMAARRGVTL